MRILLALICVALSGAAAALETARSLAASGAPQLALARIEALQPGDPAAPRWAEWEVLRLGLLVELKRHGEALKRAAALPANLPQPALRQCLLAAIRAAVAAGQPATARAYGARLLWQLEPTADEARAARLLVIETHLAERAGEAAFRAMLRFEQDYRPLERAVAEHFVERLLDLGLEKEAVNWLAALEDGGALKLRLRLKTGLAEADAAIPQARAQIAKGGGAPYWQVLADAAEKKGDGTLRVEALEQLLQAGEDGRQGPAQVNALWQAYDREAQAAANQNRLLKGDDPAWLDLAARRLGSSPPRSRALFAYLSRNGAARATRLGAQLQLVFSLYQSGLDHAALSLFGDEQMAAETLDPQARYLLGAMAESRKAPALAVRFWRGLATPPDASAAEWQARFAAMQWRSGMEDAALGTVRTLVSLSKTLPEPAVTRVLALAREMLGAGKTGAAEEVYALLLPVAGRAHGRAILFALGGIAESASLSARAAGYFLRAALFDEALATDALALQARFAAAENLVRAGFREDARAQLQWLLKNAKDGSQRERARLELSRLPP